MALYKSKQAASRAAAISPDGGNCAIPLVFEHVVAAGQFALNDIIELGALPAGTVVLSPPTLVVDDIDTGTTLVVDVGLMSGQYLAALDDAGAARTCGAEFFSASTLGQAGGVAVSSVKAGMLLVPSFSDRSIGLKITTAAAGLIAGAKIRLLLAVAPAPVAMALA